jgi:hypothetical protein
MKNASVIRAKFRRGALNFAKTKLWEDINSLNKEEILKNIDLLTSEDIIVCFFQSVDYLWLLTNIRLIIIKASTFQDIRYEEIMNVEPKQIFTHEKTTLDCDILSIFTKKNEIFLKVEERTWYIIYEILKFLAK